MDNKKSISDYTESEFLAFVKKIFNPDNTALLQIVGGDKLIIPFC
ncbi:bacteriocin immunity protein [Klebsiella quasipneumoniae]